MLIHELLINKHFELNEYPEGKFYELVVENNESQIVGIFNAAHVDYDPTNVDKKIILQMKEDFSNKLICVENNVWDLSDGEFLEVVNVIR